MRFLLPVSLKVCDMLFLGLLKKVFTRARSWLEAKLTRAHHCHFACLGRRHRGLHSVRFLVSHLLYIPSERWHPSVQTTVRAWAPPSPPCPVTRTFGSAIRDYERNSTRTTMQLQELTFRSRSLMNSSGRTTARVTVSLMASPSQPWPFFPPPLSPHAPLQYTT